MGKIGVQDKTCRAPIKRTVTHSGRAMWSSVSRSLVERLSTAWPDNEAVNIVCHGHSVPAGYFRTPRVQTLDSYPQLLLAALKSAFPFAIINVIVTARGGEASNSGAARFADQVLCHRPALVTIDYSLNDRAIGLEAALQSWIAMIEAARAAGAEVVLLTPTPDQTARLEEPQDPLNQHAEQVRRLASRYQTGLADCAAAFQRWIASGGRAARNHSACGGRS